MKVVFDQDTYVASTWGHADSFEAGVPKVVGKDFGVLCLQQGARELDDTEEVVVAEPVEEAPAGDAVVDLESMTKIQLEEYGRTIGIELDRRKTKANLIEELKAAIN
tara:strand:+ start:142 stop:462 length:321 start_codon:yes stop_codon:yes gene_type:complete